MKVTDDMVNRFLTWPLPESVCADFCATKQGYPDRTGTNLLSFTEAREMLEYVLSKPIRMDVNAVGSLVNGIMQQRRKRTQKQGPYKAGATVKAQTAVRRIEKAMKEK